MDKFRLETDLLGEKQVPGDAYYGIQTLRAMENFPLSHTKLNRYPSLIKSLAWVKKAAAATNHKLGLLPDDIYGAINEACDEIINGAFHDFFPVDIYQGGAGTSTNMNANEVIANIALELLGHEKGDYTYVSPNDHVNLSQSTNDAYPTALKLAVYDMHLHLLPVLEQLEAALRAKAIEFREVIKMGRTQLQDAVPMTLGQEFDGFAYLIKTAIADLKKGESTLLEINMGATAIGTGINAPKGFSGMCAAQLATMLDAPVVATENLIATTSDTTGFVEYSGLLKKLALKLTKICNDLRLLSSGPRAGLNELRLPECQPGSSIMPGKVNPVIPEVVNQVCYRVIGNDLTITLAAENAQLQLNVMEPVIGACLFESVQLLQNSVDILTERCIKGIAANPLVTEQMVKGSVGIVTALNPYIGYKLGSAIAKEALLEHKSVQQVVLEKGLLTEEQLEKYLDPKAMV